MNIRLTKLQAKLIVEAIQFWLGHHKTLKMLADANPNWSPQLAHLDEMKAQCKAILDELNEELGDNN